MREALAAPVAHSEPPWATSSTAAMMASPSVQPSTQATWAATMARSQDRARKERGDPHSKPCGQWASSGSSQRLNCHRQCQRMVSRGRLLTRKPGLRPGQRTPPSHRNRFGPSRRSASASGRLCPARGVEDRGGGAEPPASHGSCHGLPQVHRTISSLKGANGGFGSKSTNLKLCPARPHVAACVTVFGRLGRPRFEFQPNRPS